MLEDLKISIILRNTAVQFLKLLYFGREDDVSGENRVNGKKMPELINMLQYPVFSGSLDDLKEENIGHLKLILSRFDTFFYEFVSKLKKSYKLQETIEAFFAESGLPELMAVSYFLGEFVFKPYDILFDEKYQRLRRIDHERNLWPMVRKFLGQVDPKNDKFPPNAKTARQLGLYAVDIQNFPDSFTSDKNASYKKWFHEYPYLDNSLNSKKARHKAYTTWLFLALVPDDVYIAFSKAHMSAKTFEPEARRMLLDRKAGLKNCLNDSPKFIKFLQNVQCDALDSLINHHNQKNPDCPLNKAELSEALRAWQVASRILKPKSTYEYQTEVGEIRFPRRKPGAGEEPVKPNLLS